MLNGDTQTALSEAVAVVERDHRGALAALHHGGEEFAAERRVTISCRLAWVISHVPIFHITQPLDSIRY